MAQNWSSKAQFRRLYGTLTSAEQREFERRVLPLFRLFCSDLQLAQAGGSMDRAGVDLHGEAHDGTWPLLVQCKGFHVIDQELGRDQVGQCLDSIEALLTAEPRVKANRFILMLNRDCRDRGVFAKLTTAVQRLVDSSIADSAEVWNPGHLLTQSFSEVFRRVNARVDALQDERRASDAQFAEECEALLTLVPHRIGSFDFNQLRIGEVAYNACVVGDPLEIETCASPTAGKSVTLVLGEFGMGKTTLANRISRTSERHTLLLRASEIPKRLTGAKDLLARAFAAEELFPEVEGEDMSIYDAMLAPCVERLLMTEETPVTLVIDGLDESPMLAQSGGGATVFDIISVPRVPVVVTMRTEFWETRKAEIARGFRGRTPPSKRSLRNQTVDVIELGLWNEQQILSLTERVAAEAATSEERSNLTQLRTAIEQGNYRQYYDDIPRRPLFLKVLIENVRHTGVRAVGRARLIAEWIEMKILRDRDPIGRIGIGSGNESAHTTLTLSILAMKTASIAMTDECEGALLLAPTCSMEDLSACDSRIAQLRDPTGLFLNSLLIPVRRESVTEPLRVRFSHRAFQEFFLAMNLVEGQFQTDSFLPETIDEWMNSIREEGVSM